MSGPEGTRRFRVVRYREVEGRLGERVVLLDESRPRASPAAALGVGPDGRLYAAFDAAVSTGRSASGWRRTAARSCGSTPTARRRQDQPARNPVFASDYRSRRAGSTGIPRPERSWVADVKRRDVEELRGSSPASRDGSPNRPRARMPLPAGTGAAGIAFYRGTLVAGVRRRSVRRCRRWPPPAAAALRQARSDAASLDRAPLAGRRQPHPGRRGRPRRRCLRGDRPRAPASGAALGAALSY